MTNKFETHSYVIVITDDCIEGCTDSPRMCINVREHNMYLK
jgi:hypothetical protein